MSRGRRLTMAAVAAVAALNLGGCAAGILPIVSGVASLASLLPFGDMFSSDDTINIDYEENAPEPMVVVDPEPDAMIRIAEASRARGDYVTAAGFYQRAAAMAPEDPAPYAGMGQVFLEGGDAERATAAFRAALRLDPKFRDALHGLGNAYIVLDKPELAAAQFQAANAIRPESRTYNGLGVALDLTGDHDLAQSVYEQGLKLDSESLALRNNMGLSLALAGAYDEAIEMLREIASLPYATARERQNLALTYGLAGRKGMAARVSRMDLGEEQVASNLEYYDWLRDQPGSAATIMLGRAPDTAPAEDRDLDASLANRLPMLPKQKVALPRALHSS